MEILNDIIIYFIKTFIMNFFIYYSFNKITQIKKIYYIKIIFISLLLACISTGIEFYINSLVSIFITCILYGIFLGLLTENKIGYSVIVNIISYAICSFCLLISSILLFIPYRLIGIPNDYIFLPFILLLQFIFIFSFFKIKKLKNGFDFINNRLNNDFADIIIIYVSIAIMLIYSLLGTFLEDISVIKNNSLIILLIFGIVMFLIIQKSLQMYYKQKLLERTMKEYEKEIEDKDEIINELKDEKFNVSKITHKFYNRQKALELLVKENIKMKKEISDELVSQNVLNIVKSLTDEYTQEFEKIKVLPELPKTGILEIDSIFRYMQSESNKNNINFQLKIIGNIYTLINNIIPKSKLETLIGDHIRDAINAVKLSDKESKDIFVILGNRDDKYELAIYDTGIEFKIDTLIKLGTEAVTTNKDKGGNGIGFVTTFEIINETKASLIITEYESSNQYTKSVTIRFDGKKEYKIISYRMEEIKNKCNNKNIIITN